jgi:serine phosphatase RsbU (regulator of sigma subunit)
MLPSLTKAVKPAKAGSLPWRERLSLASMLTWTAALSILSASLIAGYYALTILYQNKLVDTWAIMFLELEHEGQTLSDRLEGLSAGLGDAANASNASNSGDAVVRLGDDGRLEAERGPFGERLRLSDFNVSGANAVADLAPLTVLGYQGEPFLVKPLAAPPGDRFKRLELRKLAPSALSLRPARPADQGALYVLTREGRLLFTNDQSITEVNAPFRPLVQRFIKAPIKQGQLEFRGGNGESLYGFFAEIPKTNIVMFSEVSKAKALAPIRHIILRFLGALGVIMVFAVLLLQLPLSRIVRPVRELALIARSVGQGRFDVAPKMKGYGELAVLSNAVSAMAAGLAERDKKVALLMREQAEKGRLAGELAIARRIQETLLPSTALPKEAGLVVAAEYISASECAGDWYHFAYDPTSGETVIVVADVSGHGAGASMFTAIIAGLFEEARSRNESTFDLQSFAERANTVLHRLGRRQWHATMMVARFVTGSEEIDILLAGHPPPVIKPPGDAPSGLPPFKGTQALGMDPDFVPTVRRIPFPKGASFMVYTDGLTEAVNPGGKSFGRKRAREAFLLGRGDPREALTRLLDGWRGYLAGKPPADDVCVVVVRAA